MKGGEKMKLHYKYQPDNSEWYTIEIDKNLIKKKLKPEYVNLSNNQLNLMIEKVISFVEHHTFTEMLVGSDEIKLDFILSEFYDTI